MSGTQPIAIIGGGIVGLATAYALTRASAARVTVLEKEERVGAHQSTHNSGVLHAGLQYAPGSAKAKLARTGIARLKAFCDEHGVAYDVCGKLVVARDGSELPRLDAMLERGRRNGLVGLRRLSPEEAQEIEPHVHCAGAIHVPEEGIVDFTGVCAALRSEIERRDATVRTGAAVRDIRRDGSSWRLLTDVGEVTAAVIVNCAGLHADRVARRAGVRPDCGIVPFRGEYHRLRSSSEHLVRHLIYPLPEPGFPFLGVHLTRRIQGGIDAGPNAVLAFAREGYTRADVDLRDLAEAMTFRGLWRFAVAHRRMVARELALSFSRARFVRALQRLVPDIASDDLEAGHAGVRAQAMHPSGALMDDFHWIERPRAVHVVNAPSPAATACLAIGEEIAARAHAALTA